MADPLEPNGRCRWCGEPVYWSQFIKADGEIGKKAPLDVVPSFRGNIELVPDSDYCRMVPKAEKAGHPRPRLLNHWATCTPAQEHRRGA